MNELKRTRPIFNTEGAIAQLDSGNPAILLLAKWTIDRRERALILINHDRDNSARLELSRLQPFLTAASRVEDISPERRLEPDHNSTYFTLEPSAVRVLWAWSDQALAL